MRQPVVSCEQRAGGGRNSGRFDRVRLVRFSPGRNLFGNGVAKKFDRLPLQNVICGNGIGVELHLNLTHFWREPLGLDQGWSRN